MTTGERIQAARKRAGLTQKELGARLGLSAASIAQWENNLRKPKLETLQRIADALNVFFYDLFDPDDKSAFEEGLKTGLFSITSIAEKLGVPVALVCEAMQRDTVNISRIGALLAYDDELRRSEAAIMNQIISALQQLNDAGQEKAVERVEELTEIPRYRRQPLPEGSDTPEEETPPVGRSGPADGE